MDMVNRLAEQLSGMIVDIPDASEDCLYLNIYTPANRAPDAKLPVRSSTLSLCDSVYLEIRLHIGLR